MLVLFACKNPSPLYRLLKGSKHLKPENLETLSLLSTLKMPIKSVTSYQAEIKFLEDVYVSECIFIFNVQMCSFFIVGNKIFCFFKKWIFSTFQRGSQVLQNFEGCSDRFIIFGVGLGKKGWGQYLRVGLIPWRTLWIAKGEVWSGSM